MNNKKPPIAVKKTSPSSKSLLPKTIKKKIKAKPGLKDTVCSKKHTVKPLNRKEAARYRSMIENIADGYFEVDLAGNFTFFNNAVCRTLGYSRRELTGKNNRFYTDKENAKKVFKAFNKIYRIGKPLKEFGFIVTRKDGTKRYIEGSISLRNNSFDKPIGFLGIVNDFTQRKQMEEALIQSEEKYRSILENMQEGYFEIDLVGNFTFFNDSLCRIDGYSRHELMGMNYRQYTDKETAKKVFQAFNRVYKTGQLLPEINFQMIRKDGTNRYTESSVSLLKDSSGKPIGFRGILRDVTDRKRAEFQKEAAIEALRKSEKYFKELTENSSDIIIITDKNGDIKYCSRSMERFTGYKPDEIIGKSGFKFIHPDDVERAVNDFGKAIMEKDTTLIPNAFRIMHKDGSEVYLDGLGRNLLNNPDIAGFVMNVRDVTDRKRAEDKLREEEQRFRALAEQSSDIIVLLNREGMITYENPAVDILGIKAEERIGASVFERVHPDDLKLMIDSFNILISNPDTSIQRSELRLRCADGGWRMFEIVASSLVHDNVVEAVIVNLRDITERKRTEERLKEAELKFRTIFDFASDGILLLNIGEGKFSAANEKICNMLGYTNEELLNLSIREIHPQESVPFVVDQAEKILKKEISIARNIPVMKKDKTVFFADISGSSITLGEKEFLAGMFRDITERKNAEDELRESTQKYWELSIIDDLTRLYNARHFYAQLEKEIERSNRYEQPLTLLLLDLDKFKDFNDTYGHVQGNYVLLRLGNAIKRSLRETDSAYRYGGEEFTIILPMTASEEGIVTAKRIQTELRKENFSLVSGQEVYMTVSIGLAQYKLREEMKTFVQRVDQLMYEVKKTERGRICYDNGKME
jgi:diguanylate cyclase (GGDEF)-like protein/PAS domain S-box-containing protein